MRRFANKRYGSPETGSTRSTADFCLICLRTPTTGGFRLEEVRERMRAIEGVEPYRFDESFELDEAQNKTLKRCVCEMVWQVLHKDILDFSDSILQETV